MASYAEYSFSLEPVEVPKTSTKYRRIITPLPVPQSLPILEILQRYEPRSMALDQVPVVWDRAEGFQVYDPYGNCWLDFSSGIFVANVGHGHSDIVSAITRMAGKPLLHNYIFPSQVRADLSKKLLELCPSNLDTVFLLTTGSEATECAIKLARIHGRKINASKLGIVSLTYGFHGKTMGAQTAGGRPAAKAWIGLLDPNFQQIPVPFCHRCPWGRTRYERCGRECFYRGLEQLVNQGFDSKTIAGFILEPFQGWSAAFQPNDFVQAMRDWATENQALMIFDEVQSGFGRTGRFFAYEHFGVEADLVCCGKGISSSLPLSAVVGRRELIDVDPSLNSTHGGNPICCAAALANLMILERDKLVQSAARTGKVLGECLSAIGVRHPDYVDCLHGRGLIWALHIIDPIKRELDMRLADLIIERAMQKGVLLMRGAVGTIKIAPPLCIPEDAVVEGALAIGEAIDEVINEISR